MTRVILDADVQAKLPRLDQQLELCDPSGQTLGFFLTVEQYEQLLVEWAKLKFPEDELERGWNEPGERTTPEVIARLRQRPQCSD
jgi:hypothetical protein